MATFDCEKPLKNRRATITGSDRASPVSRRHPAITEKLVSSTGMITPTAIMSMSTAIRMKKIVAVGRWDAMERPRR
jgi:hypothetical protein